MNSRNPIKYLYLDINQNCNLSCIMCDMVRTGEMIDAAWLKKYIDTNDDFFREVQTVVIGHQAEPLLNPDVAGVIDLFKRRHVEVIMITNGKCLSERIDEICATDLDTLLFSVDSHNPERLENIRKGIDAEQLFSAIGQLAEKKKDKLQLVFNVCLMRRNIADLPKIIELASLLNVGEVRLQFLIVGKPELIYESLYFYQEKTNGYMALAEDMARKKGVRFEPRYFREDGLKPVVPRSFCHMPFDTLYISGSKDCYACYTQFLGNIQNKDMSQIWYGSTIQDFRTDVLTPGSSNCQNCTYCEVQNVDHPESFFSDKIFAELSESLIREIAKEKRNTQEIRTLIKEAKTKMEREQQLVCIYRHASELKSNGEWMKSQQLFSKILDEDHMLNDSLKGGINFHLGTISFHMDDINQASHYFQTCLKWIPDHIKAKQHLHDLLEIT